MGYNDMMEQEEIYSKVLRAGRRTYFFDVRSTKAGDYYLTITESKKFTNDDWSFHYKKHKIYLYKEDFAEFRENVIEMTDYIIAEKGEEVISERHQKDFKKEYETNDTVADEKVEDKVEDKVEEKVEEEVETKDKNANENFTEVDFDDI